MGDSLQAGFAYLFAADHAFTVGPLFNAMKRFIDVIDQAAGFGREHESHLPLHIIRPLICHMV
jgi:hypothetical protein